MFKKIKNKIINFFSFSKIKGNIKSDGSKIYHVPGGRFYDITEAEVRFKTEEAAVKAGFKKSKQ